MANPKPTTLPEWASDSSSLLAWAPSTAYALDALRRNGARVYRVTSAGTSAGAGGPTGTADTIYDNSVVWSYEGEWLDSTITVEPSSGKKKIGFLMGEDPPSQFFNWLFLWIYKWILYLDTLAQNAITWTAAHTFSNTAPVTMNSTLHVVGTATFDVDGAGWQTLTLNTAGNWAADTSSGNYLAPQYRIDSFGRVRFRGQARRSTGFNTTIASLPTAIKVGASLKLPYRFVCAAEVSGSLTPCVVNVYVTGGAIGGSNNDKLIIHGGAIGASDDVVLSVDLAGIGPYYVGA